MNHEQKLDWSLLALLVLYVLGMCFGLVSDDADLHELGDTLKQGFLPFSGIIAAGLGRNKLLEAIRPRGKDKDPPSKEE